MSKQVNAQHPTVDLISIDLMSPVSTSIPVIQDCKYILHIANPNPVPGKKIKNSERMIVQPAIQGTLTVLQAASDPSSIVERVVLTSSSASIMYGHSLSSEYGNGQHVFTENDWSNETNLDGYLKSKPIAEKAAWEYVRSQDQLPSTSHRYSLTTICPTMVMGPLLNNKSSFSAEFMKQVLSGEMSPLPNMNVPIVDVRDVSLAHVRAMTTPSAANQRYILSNSGVGIPLPHVARYLKEHFPTLPISERSIGVCVLGIVRHFHSAARAIYPDVRYKREIDSSKSVNELGIQYIPWTTAAIDMTASLIQHKIINQH